MAQPTWIKLRTIEATNHSRTLLLDANECFFSEVVWVDDTTPGITPQPNRRARSCCVVGNGSFFLLDTIEELYAMLVPTMH